MLSAVADALLLARATLGEQLGKLQYSLARNDLRSRLLITTPQKPDRKRDETDETQSCVRRSDNNPSINAMKG